MLIVLLVSITANNMKPGTIGRILSKNFCLAKQRACCGLKGIEEIISGAHDDRLCGVVHANTVQGRVNSILQPEGLGVSSWGVEETTNVEGLGPERHSPPQSCRPLTPSAAPLARTAARLTEIMDTKNGFIEACFRTATPFFRSATS